MASRAPAYDATPLDVLLASVPSLPRAILARLTARMIERMDEKKRLLTWYASINPTKGAIRCSEDFTI
ncbi:hypothetical protein C8J46_105434 [Sphingomonas sp. PP-F2F-A104-K0414]|nr:hypothetical protein C8J46_105434 [Sphingomonas sp. PP-F2F-A104-K0414]